MNFTREDLAKLGAPLVLALALLAAGAAIAWSASDARAKALTRVAAALAGSGYQLVRTQLPFDVTSEGTLTGDIGAAADTAEAPRFTIVVARRLL